MLVLLTPHEVREFLPEPLWSELRALAPDLKVIDPTGLQPGEFAKLLDRIDPAVVLACWNSPPLPATLPPRLRYFCYLSGSVRALIMREHIERGLLVTNWGGSISRTIAEGALLHVLSCLRRTTFWTLSMHVDRQWARREVEPRSIFGRRVGFHGFGRIARDLVHLLRPFDCSVSVFAPDIDAATEAAFGITRAASLEELFESNDVLVEVAPLIPATRGAVTESLLRRIPPGGVFVNVGRGAVVDEAGLARVAQEGHLQIGLDVFAHEPLPPDSPLRGLRNVSLTPHVAGPTTDRRCDAGALALRNLRAFSIGDPLEAVITPAIYDQAT